MQPIMNFTPQNVDALLQACVEYRKDHGLYFYAGNLAGRQGLSADAEQVKQLMDWIVETDDKLLAFKGFGDDNVSYYRLGRDAEEMLKGGGFGTYLTKKKRLAALSQASIWLPVVASIAAVVVSCLAWQAPKDDEQAMAKIAEKLGSLQTQLEAQQGTDSTLATAIDDLRKEVALLSKRVPAKPPGKK
jgi:hypothetical protein